MDEEEGGELDEIIGEEFQKKEKAKPGKEGAKANKIGLKAGIKKTTPSRASSIGTSQQQLFLVEFLVDTVAIDSCSVDEEVLQGQTCLTLSFLNFPPMEICEKDFDPNKESGSDKVRFNCGKSLMFAMNEQQCQKPPPLSLDILVSKKIMDNRENPCKVEIGVIKVCVAELFRQVVEIAQFHPDKLPASKSIKDCFMLVGPGKRTMGQVSVYIRMSCLGQNVVTEFQCGPDLKTSPVLFKSREGKKVYEFSGKEPGFLEGECQQDRGGPVRAGVSGVGHFPGGQGDGGKSVTHVQSRGNRVVLDIPRPGGRGGAGGRAGDRGDCSKHTFARSVCEGGKGGGGGGGGVNGMMTVSKQEPNPDQNCFVLKVGDKGQITDRGKMILEFKTPKQKILPKVLPPYHEEVAVQTDSGKRKGKGKKKKRKNF